MRNVADDPSYMPCTSVLVAKTCVDCGQFLDAHQFWRNGNGGHRPECTLCATHRLDKTPGTAWHIPRTGILLAKTCADCGKLLGAQRFWRNGKPARWSACARCMKGRNYRYHRNAA